MVYSKGLSRSLKPLFGAPLLKGPTEAPCAPSCRIPPIHKLQRNQLWPAHVLQSMHNHKARRRYGHAQPKEDKDSHVALRGPREQDRCRDEQEGGEQDIGHRLDVHRPMVHKGRPDTLVGMEVSQKDVKPILPRPVEEVVPDVANGRVDKVLHGARFGSSAQAREICL